MNRNRNCILQYSIILIIVLSYGCFKVGPNYSPPETNMPDEWHEAITYGLNEGKANLQTWWIVFNDPILNGLIERARVANYDVKQAVARVSQARAQLNFAKGEYVPFIEGSGSLERSRTSKGIVEGENFPPPQTRTDTIIDLGGNASWERDLWGRIARSVESAEASYEASIEDYRDVLVVLFSDVASNYVSVRTVQDRIKLAQSNVELQKKTLQLTRDRFKAGLSPLLDVRQAELNLSTTESTIPTLQFQLVQAINRIGVLLGEYPSALQAELTKLAQIPAPPDDIAIGLPAELLRQRPDIRLAERNVAAQTAQIGVATAELFPQFSIFGTLGLEAVDSVTFFKGSNVIFGFGPQFSWRIFEGGRLRSNIKIQEAVTEELLYSYENTVLTALEEVENSMVAYVQETDRKESLERSATAAGSAVDLVETLYKTGLTNFQNVFDTQRSLFQQQDQLADSKGNIVQNLISLYKALGGGWSPEPENEIFTYEKLEATQSDYIREEDKKLTSEKSNGIDVRKTQNELK